MMLMGKYDSQWKQQYDVRLLRYTGRKERGTFCSAMQYARRHKGGMTLIEHARRQPWETWQAQCT